MVTSNTSAYTNVRLNLGFISVKANMCYAPDVPRSDHKPAPLDRFFRAFADRTRLRLINLLAGQELCVCYLVEVIDVPQPKISRHLAYLRQAGIVAARREGKWMHYRLVVPSDVHAAGILKNTIDSLKKDKEMQRDLEKLKQACRGPESLVQLIGAPAPVHV
jgi:ArsR family transcriptional regulator, arsenate/arsenite/antimonite-responsive transcriptional repressor